MKHTISHLFPTYFLLFFGAAFCVSACIKKASSPDKIVIQQKSDPVDLLPNGKGVANAESNNIGVLIFQPLLDIDMFSYELTPVLAAARPTIARSSDGKMTFAFDIRPEAAWDNGQPVVAEDIAFTCKMLQAAGMEGSAIRAQLTTLEKIILDPKRPKHVELVFGDVNEFRELDFTNLRIVPHYIYDPKNVLTKYSYEDLLTNRTHLADADFKAFSSELLSVEFSRNTVIGSGAYTFKSWTTDKSVVLERKKSWWGDKVTTNKNHYFEANPKAIVFETIKDEVAAIAALQGGSIDFMPSVSPDAYLKTDFSAVADTFSMESCVSFYLGLNLQDPILADIKNRQALEAVSDRVGIIQNVMRNCATPAASICSPRLAIANKDLKPNDYDLAKAKTLLAEANWTDSDRDGVLDKMIGGKKTPFALNFMYGTTSPVGAKVFALLEESAKKVGIKLIGQPTDGSEIQKKMKEGNTQIWFSGRGGPPVQSNQSIYWKTGGEMNYSKLANTTVDSLIVAHNKEPDEAKRLAMFKILQAKLQEQKPFIFLYTRNILQVLNKKYTLGSQSMQNPGYWTGSIRQK